MKARCLLIVLLFFLSGSHIQSQIAVGQWRDHVSYNNAKQVCIARTLVKSESESFVYGVSAQSLFRCNLNPISITPLGKASGLSDIGVNTVEHSPLGYTVIGYSNGNVDILYHERTFNISDIKRSNISGDKGINNITFRGHRAYLACGFGIVVINLDRREIDETYYLGENGGYLAINDIAFSEHYIFAATNQGLLFADKNNPHLNISDNWIPDTLSVLHSKVIEKVITTENSDAVFAIGFDFDPTLRTLYYTPDASLPMNHLDRYSEWLTGNIKSVDVSLAKVVVSWGERVDIFDESSRVLERSVGDINWLKMEANDAALFDEDHLFIAHSWASLVMVDLQSNEITSFAPSSPMSPNVYKLVSFEDRLMVCPGGKTTTFSNSYLDPNVFTFQKERWKTLDKTNFNAPIFDILDVAVNPKKKSQSLAASWGFGIMEIEDGKAVQIYDTSNTDGALEAYSSNGFSSLRTGAVAFDKKGNAWITVSKVRNGLAVRYKDGSWKSFDTEKIVNNDEIDKLICDSVRGYKWFAGRANRIYVHDGENRLAYVNPNQGSKLETSTVTCLVQDHDGDIWIGTNKGLKLIVNGYSAFSNGGNGELSPVNCLNITISNGEFAEYLMAYESVTCIAVDGADRKWVGTASGGLYLISANGLDEIEHFTTTNSPLYSNKIISVSVQPKTGEVFIATDKGLQSYRGTATYAEHYPESNVHAFPNPVRPDYEGPISIKGFSRNALVHITDAAGHVVFSATSNGGQAIWNGRTNEGQKVASGTYFVFASDEQGQMRAVTKVLIIR